MRGKDHLDANAIPTAGITPAYAGKSSFQNRSFSSREDHPRLCGEKSLRKHSVMWRAGSPPPMRGKVRVGEAYSRAYRITPAYAGKRSSLFQFLFLSRDHPRLCGEKFLSALWKIFLTGSPPPMRGKAAETLTDSGCIGITPAYAGKRPHHTVQKGSSWDHPRLCGEKQSYLKTSKSKKGSPPPMRGKAQAAVWTELSIRITPAYAGKSDFVAVHKFILKDHPRLCGEKDELDDGAKTATGSPPPMRGKVFPVPPQVLERRITPAYAGKR